MPFVSHVGSQLGAQYKIYQPKHGKQNAKATHFQLGFWSYLPPYILLLTVHNLEHCRQRRYDIRQSFGALSYKNLPELVLLQLEQCHFELSLCNNMIFYFVDPRKRFQYNLNRVSISHEVS